jgi:hypothetical protein
MLGLLTSTINKSAVSRHQQATSLFTSQLTAGDRMNPEGVLKFAHQDPIVD